MRWRCPKSGRPVEMNSPVWQNPWRLMLVVNIAVVIGVFLHKLTLPPYIPYVHLLVDYHFGFTKRALIGAIIAEFFGSPTVGMGFRISTEAARMNMGLVWATILVAAISGSVFYGLLAWLQRRATFWHPSQRKD